MSRSVWWIAAALLVGVSAYAVCADTGWQAVSFESNGDLINDWYWLRDVDLSHKATWMFEGIAEGTEDVVLEITCLATDRASGGRGFPATFRIAYGFPGTAMMGGAFVVQEVTLPNVSPPEDVLGYTCQGTVSIPRTTPGLSTGALTVFVERMAPQGPHVAFQQGSIVLRVVGESESVVLQGYVVKMRQNWCTRSEGPLYLLQAADLSQGLAGIYRLEYGTVFPWQDDPLLEAWVNADVEVTGTLSLPDGALLPVLTVEAIVATDMHQRCAP
jgi:hypothetical protein